MPTKMLTDRSIQALKPTAHRVEYLDAKLPGLALRVTPNGVKSWTIRYRHRGHMRRMTLGTLDVVTLAKARERARDLLHDASKGADPATTKREAHKAETFGDLADLFITKYAMVKKRSWRADQTLLKRKVLPKWRHRAVADITRRDVRHLVDTMAAAGAPIRANRLVSLLSKVFKFAVSEEVIEESPAISIPKPGQERQRDHVLSDDELRTFWRECDALPVAMSAYFKLRLATVQRGAEVASMRWQDLDLESGWWTIPATSSKNKLSHRVPLNLTATTILATILATADKESIYVLDGARGKRQQSEAAALFTVENFRGHDLRRTAATCMGSGGIARLTIGKILNHVDNSVTAIYDRASYDAEKQAAVTWWDAKLTAILTTNKAATVLAFQRGA